MSNRVRNITIFSLGAIVLTLILLALPGQFVNLGPDWAAKDLSMGGYQAIFGGSTEARYTTFGSNDAVISATGIAMLVLILLAVPCYLFHKKSSALLLLGGLIMLVAAIIMFCTRGWVHKMYTPASLDKYPDAVAGWTAYLSASLLMLGAISTLVVSIMELVKESRQPYQPKKETYSYLKNK